MDHVVLDIVKGEEVIENLPERVHVESLSLLVLLHTKLFRNSSYWNILIAKEISPCRHHLIDELLR